MLFKNLIHFNATDTMPIWETLNSALNNHPLVPLEKQPHAGLTMGAVSVVDGSPGLVVTVGGGSAAFKIRREEKIVPASAVADAFLAKLEEIEAGGAALNKRERAALKDDIISELTARALTKASVINGWIDSDGVWLDASSHSRAEDVVSYLRKCLGGLPVVTAASTVNHNPEHSFTNWLTSPPDNFTVGRWFHLKSPDEGGAVARLSNIDSDSDEVREHIDAGLLVTALELNWKDRVSFRVDKDLVIKSVSFLDIVTESSARDDAECQRDLWDADFAINSGELTTLFNELTSALRD